MDSMRFVLKIGELEKYLHMIDDILPNNEGEYHKNTLKRLATERLLQLCIEVVLDLCAMLVQHLKLGPPTDEENILDLLMGQITNINIIREMKRFRNILVHRYGEIDNDKVYDNAIKGRDDFDRIIEEFRKKIPELL